MAASLCLTFDQKKSKSQASVICEGEVHDNELFTIAFLMGFVGLIYETNSVNNTNDAFFNLVEESHRARFEELWKAHLENIIDPAGYEEQSLKEGKGNL
jgi:hypothetical protein